MFNLQDHYIISHQCSENNVHNTIVPCRCRLVLHGGIDGYSRLVYLHCSTDNRASTVLELLRATFKFGFPSHVRSDKGSENKLVALHVLSQVGTNGNSMLTGRSVHNQRIERFCFMFQHL